MKKSLLGTTLAGAMLLAGFVAAPMSAASSPAAAPAATGPNCKLDTPIAKAQCPEVTAAVIVKATQLDPTVPRNLTDTQISYPAMGLLWRFDENLVPRLDLLASHTVSKDGKTVTQKLKPGLKYSDGTPVVAQDIVTAFDRWRKGGISSSFIAKVSGVTAPDAQTAVWTLASPFPDFPYVLASNFLFINPSDRVLADPKAYFRNPVSAGPMVIRNFDPNSDTTILEANPNYWAKPRVGRVTYKTIPDGASRLLALKDGSVDYVYDLAYTAVDNIDKSKVRVFGHPLPGTYTLTTNMAKTNSPLQDVKVRQAMSAVLDRARIAKVAFFDTVAPSCANTFRKGNPYFVCALPSQGRQNIELAKKLMAESKYPNGFDVPLIVNARPAWPEAALLIADDLKKIGINAKVEVYPDAVMVQKWTSGDYELTFTGNVQPTPILQMLNWYETGGAWANFSRYVDRVVADTLQQAASALNPAQVKALLLKANQQAYGNSVHIPIADRAVVSGTTLPKGVWVTATPGELTTVATVPALSAQPGPPAAG
jgi:peptide/nickel transport system substrate-binding protein